MSLVQTISLFTQCSIAENDLSERDDLLTALSRCSTKLKELNGVSHVEVARFNRVERVNRFTEASEQGVGERKNYYHLVLHVEGEGAEGQNPLLHELTSAEVQGLFRQYFPQRLSLVIDSTVAGEIQPSSRYKLHLLGSELSDSEIEMLFRFCNQQGLQVDQLAIDTECVTLDVLIPESAETSASNNPAADVQQQLKQLAQDNGLDAVLIKDDIYRRNRRLVVFDMDSTLIKVEVIDELAKRAGIGEEVSRITASSMRGEIDFDESFKRRLGLLKGLSDTVLADIAATLPMMEGMEKLITNLNALGYKTAILSGGFSYFAEHLQQKYGFNEVYSNQLDVIDGKVTGEVRGDIVNGERKALLLQQLAEQEGFDLQQTVAVGDGANDLPMLKMAGLGVAFHAKPIVVEQAPHAISHLGLDALLYLLDVSSAQRFNSQY